jgi:hypothetical protein
MTQYINQLISQIIQVNTLTYITAHSLALQIDLFLMPYNIHRFFMFVKT